MSLATMEQTSRRVLALIALILCLPGCRSAGEGPVAGTAQAPTARRGQSADGTVPSADGVAIHYHVDGSGSPAVVLLHGWACDGSIWAAQVRQLAPRMTVVTVDLAGHGQSGRGRTAWSVPAFARDVGGVIDRLGLERVILVGHSMSGSVSLEAARLFPDKVLAIIPVDTLQDAEWKPGKAFEDLLESMRTDFVTSTREFVKHLFPETAEPALVERMATRMSAMPPDIGIAVLRAILSYDVKDALSQVKRPIRAINSEGFPTRLDVNRRYAPQFEVTLMTGTGHFPMLEKPAEFNEILILTIEDLTR